MAVPRCFSPLLALAAAAAGAALPRLALGSSTCEEAEGRCTVIAVLANTTTEKDFRGSSGIAEDGACPLGEAAPVQEVSYLKATGIAIMYFKDDRTQCCQALKILSDCKHIKSAELDQPIGLAQDADTPSSACKGAQLLSGECTVLGTLSSGVTGEEFSGTSGTGADGVCTLGSHAPSKSVETLSSSIVVLRFGTDVDKCCKAKQALDGCPSMASVEYDSEVTIASGVKSSATVTTSQGQSISSDSMPSHSTNAAGVAVSASAFAALVALPLC